MEKQHKHFSIVFSEIAKNVEDAPKCPNARRLLLVIENYPSYADQMHAENGVLHFSTKTADFSCRQLNKS